MSQLFSDQDTASGTTPGTALGRRTRHASTADYDHGLGCVMLARKSGIGENTVRARLKEAGVEVRSPGALDADQLGAIDPPRIRAGRSRRSVSGMA
jgi:hypothetical protein